MSENKSVGSPFERAMEKIGEPGSSSSEVPLRVVDADGRVRPIRQHAPMDTGIDFSRFPVSDADFERFEMRFGVGPGQQTSFNNAFRMVRTQVLQSLETKRGQVIGITSPTARNGKTVCSIHLARACARRPEQAVVLADLNLQRPLLAGYLDAREFRSGIGYFRGEGDPEDYLTRAGSANLLLFMSDRATAQSAELLASGRLNEALEAFRRVAPNTVVILNLPPILGADDVLTIMPQLDGVVLVAAANESRFNEVEEAANLIPEDKRLCAILNKSRYVHDAATSD